MNGAKRHTLDTSASNEPPRFPPEAYDYNDDITHVAVEKVRFKSAQRIAEEEWELVDGFVS